MFKRKAYQELLHWKNKSQGKRALLIEGARRVGKSTLVNSFAKNEYASNIIIDFSKASPDIKTLFEDYRWDIDKFFMYLQAYTGVTLRTRNSIIVFDEIQLFPPAREFIKQLVDDRRYDYIETGSLISIRENVKDIVIPSEETSLKLNPFDFEEFLWACGEDVLSKSICESFDNKSPLPQALHRKSEQLLREYMLVGGMPQAIQSYVDEQNFGEVDAIKRDILTLYKNDIEKFGASNTTQIRRVFSTLPAQLARHDKKFRLSSLDKNARSRDYADAFFWLSNSCITQNCLNVSDPAIGLAASANESSFKCYMADTGLLVAQLFSDNTKTPHELYKDILQGKIEINEGMFTENYVAQQLAASGHKLYFYSKTDKENSANTMKIDFLISTEYDNAAGKMRISPIEVKSTKRYGIKSLEKFKAKFKKRVGIQYVLHPKPMSLEGELVKLPLYMAHLL